MKTLGEILPKKIYDLLIEYDKYLNDEDYILFEASQRESYYQAQRERIFRIQHIQHILIPFFSFKDGYERLCSKCGKKIDFLYMFINCRSFGISHIDLIKMWCIKDLIDSKIKIKINFYCCHCFGAESLKALTTILIIDDAITYKRRGQKD